MVLGGACACRLADEQEVKNAIAEQKGAGEDVPGHEAHGQERAPFHCLFLLAFIPFFHGSPGEWAPPCSCEQGPLT